MSVSNVAYGVLVTSDIACGRVKALHLDEARAVPGVVDIISYGDTAGIKPLRFGSAGYTSLAPQQDRKIVHDGQIMALVVANTYEAAKEAAGKVTADYAQEQPSAGLDSPGTETIPAVVNRSGFAGGWFS